MGRKRKKRRPEGLAPVVSSVESLRALASTRPKEAAAALARARRGEGPLRVGASELDDLTVFVAGELRKRRALEGARALLDTLSSRTVRADLELALVALAGGDDAELRAIAQRTPALAPTLEPLLAVVDRREVSRAKKGASAASKSLHAAARAVAASAQGDVKGALRAASGLAAPHRARMSAALRLAAGRGKWDDARALASDDPLRRLALAAAAQNGHARDVLAHARPSELDVRHHALAALRDDLYAGEVLQLVVAEHLEQLFARPGDVVLGAAFATLRERDTTEAVALFERAASLGTDEGERLRGRWLALRWRREPWHPFARAATQYARFLADDPRHAAARAAVIVDLAMARVERGTELRDALEDVEGVRASLGETWLATRGLEASVDRAQARVLIAMGEPEAARPFAERALANDRAHPYSWEVALDLAPPEERERVRAEALEATGDAGRFAPLRIGPGAVARALAESDEGSLHDDLALIAREAAAIPAAERAPLDVGLLYVLFARHGERAAGFVEARLRDAPEHGRDLAIAALLLGMEAPVRAWLSASRPPLALQALGDVVVAGAAAGLHAAERLLGRVAPWLTRRELDLLSSRVTRRAAAAAEGLGQEVFERAHDALHPELCLERYLDGDLLDDEAADELIDELDDEEMLDELLGRTLAQLGVRPSEVAAVPASRKRAFIERVLGQMEAGSPSRAEMSGALLELLGYDPLRGSRPRKPKKRKRRR